MTRTFTYTFARPALKAGANGNKESDWYPETVVLKKRVTDKMEPRNFHKPAYAADYFNMILRRDYGYHTSVVTARNLVEVTK